MHRISSLQTETYCNQALSFGNRIMRSPLDTPIIPWKILPTSALFEDHYRIKKEFLSLSKIISHHLGKPESVCMLADTIMGVTNWESVSIEEQYLSLQQSAGVFEASSMTYLNIKGLDAEKLLNRLTPRNIQKLQPGEAKFVIFTTPLGTVDDDAMILRLSANEFLLSCGGSKLPQQTLTYLPQVIEEFPNVTISWPTIISFNIKGPKRVKAIMHLLSDADKAKVHSLKVYQFCQAKILNGDTVWIIKTKIGIEMWGEPPAIQWAWRYMLDNRKIYTPCGWDVLHLYRMECEDLQFTVYPFDIHNATTLWEIGCEWMIHEKESDYLGRKTLIQGEYQKIFELKKIKALSHLTHTAKIGAILRRENGDFAGYVTSSAFSIKAKRAVAFAHLLIEDKPSAKFYLERTQDKWELLHPSFTR